MKYIRSLKENNPLIHCITNPISINQCANAILAVGCRPIMAEHPSEVREITKASQALLLNLGNITDVRMESMLISAKAATEQKIPIVIDAVGIACSELRRDFVCRLIENNKPTVIKGNYSEINALYNSSYKAAGVDSEAVLDEKIISAASISLSEKYNSIILASGKTDIVTDGRKLLRIGNGSLQLAQVTGTGCMLGALAACCMSGEKSTEAAALACGILGICGELSETNKGSGSFMINLIDNLSLLTDKMLKENLKMEEMNIEKA